MREKLKGFTKFEKVSEVVKRLLNSVSIKAGVEEVELPESVGRYSAEDLRAPYDYPRFDRSAVDGYAVMSRDVVGASETNPVSLKVVAEFHEITESVDGVSLSEGEAVFVPTGAPLPQGADAVVPVEYTVREGDIVYVLKGVPPYGNVSRKGEDFREGEVIVRRGTKLRPWHVAALAQAGIYKIRVFRKVRVGVLNVGSELCEPWECGKPSSTINSSGYLIQSFVKEVGGKPLYLGIVPDEFNAIKEKVIEALSTADAVVITGGTSVGKKDLVPDVLSSLPNSKLVFHGVATRPGRTAGAFVVSGKPVLMLSGLPVACLLGLELYLKPLILKAYDAGGEIEVKVRGKLVRRLNNVLGFRSYYRVVVYRGGGDELLVEPLRLTGSGIISTLLKGNGIVEIPEGLEGYDEGEVVEVTLINPIYESRPEFLDGG